METPVIDKKLITIQFRVKPKLQHFQDCSFHPYLRDWSTLFVADIPITDDPKEYIPASTALLEFQLKPI